ENPGRYNQYQPKESVTDNMTGLIHHALAFSTLLSSQETDANTFRSIEMIGLQRRRLPLWKLYHTRSSPVNPPQFEVNHPNTVK
ncbi:hypothetical protein, partial [Microtetraspora sp. NBRC 13810]|uniref:hypothetical protein n=1 Tax=Microtetraspora sp. NBRC 13810 TaxID=3030990 RepID=UPI002554229D